MTSQARNHPFTGCMTALVTPFKNGKVDYDALTKLVEWQIEQGIDAIVSVGTTGESATLDVEEHIAVIGATVKAAKGRIPIIAGAGGRQDARGAVVLRLRREKTS